MKRVQEPVVLTLLLKGNCPHFTSFKLCEYDGRSAIPISDLILHPEKEILLPSREPSVL